MGLGFFIWRNGGQTPLHYCCSWFSDCEILKKFLSLNIEIDVQDDNGNTPLHQAIISSSSVEFIQLLLDYGASIFIKNKFNKTAKDLLLENKNLSSLKILEKTLNKTQKENEINNSEKD
ncbi:ankyrin repeat ph and sec7 domain containing protein secg-related [Anaeramoeba flamelloides]|uniref:Ankyrin repeat ph and sec7 domain containing protein secg-related n=1 Tax=Anaeramoeba flamelloides TaxID=1746091 RepID=A0AAV7YXJ5_9EUKA|nr:ankyrin repeat ph and sec7 domain containing protein secg-related [Anaeramoeba flamelloides]